MHWKLIHHSYKHQQHYHRISIGNVLYQQIRFAQLNPNQKKWPTAISSSAHIVYNYQTYKILASRHRYIYCIASNFRSLKFLLFHLLFMNPFVYFEVPVLFFELSRKFRGKFL